MHTLHSVQTGKQLDKFALELLLQEIKTSNIKYAFNECNRLITMTTLQFYSNTYASLFLG